MATVSSRERIAHVVRRLSMGAHPDLVAGLADTDAAVAACLARSGPVSTPPALAAPASYRSARPQEVVPLIGWWLDQMRSPARLLDERMVWFWHDHFATSLRKVRVPLFLRTQHVTVRQHATGSFADLLHAVAKDPAMLLFLDGVTNTAGKVNENFGRECMELFTMGRDGGYTQDDVVAASRSFTGWVVNVVGQPASDRLTTLGIAPWTAGFLPNRHDASTKTLLGRTGAFDLDRALDVILEHPSTGPYVTAKLYRQLVGQTPSDATARRLGATFARDYQIQPLVEAIVADHAFTADEAVRARVRTPVEKLIGILQAAGGATAGERLDRGERGLVAAGALRTIDYLPFLPPNVGGFASGPVLLGPHELVSTFDLLGVLADAPAPSKDVDALMARFSIFDVSTSTRRVLEAEHDPGRRFALAALSPEFALV